MKIEELLFECEIDTITSTTGLPVIEERLRTLAGKLNGADPLRRATVRQMVIDKLKDAKINAAAGLVTAALDQGRADQTNIADTFLSVEPWAEPVELAEVLPRVAAFIRRYMVLPAVVADALAVCVAFTYVVAAFNISPYIIVRSPIKRCGKSLLLDLMELLVYRAFSTVSVSAATLFRIIDEAAPTVLIDEAEVLGAQGDRAEAVREILNAGYRRGPGVPRCVGDDHHVERFHVFGPKILAAIGRLWDTLEDRALVVELKRKRRDETVERFRRRKAEPVAFELRRQLSRWGQDHVDELRDAAPVLPDFLDDRAQDTWEPLLAIGGLAGDGWPERLVEAAKALNGVRVEDDAPGVQLLADLEAMFTIRKVDKITSVEVVESLRMLEDRPWSEWKGKPITARQVASLLRRFGIRPKTIRIGETTPSGYDQADFADAFSRYVGGGDRPHPQQSSNRATNPPFGDRPQGQAVGDPQMPEKPHGASLVANVGDLNPLDEGGATTPDSSARRSGVRGAHDAG